MYSVPINNFYFYGAFVQSIFLLLELKFSFLVDNMDPNQHKETLNFEAS